MQLSVCEIFQIRAGGLLNSGVHGIEKLSSAPAESFIATLMIASTCSMSCVVSGSCVALFFRTVQAAANIKWFLSQISAG